MRYNIDKQDNQNQHSGATFKYTFTYVHLSNVVRKAFWVQNII